MDVLFKNEFGNFWIDPETGNLCVSSQLLTEPFKLDLYSDDNGEINFDWSILDTPEDDVQKTEGHAEFTIFDDDEDDAIHIQIDPAFAWSKDDVWELIGELLYRVGEIDEDGNVAGNNVQNREPKPLFVVTVDNVLSKETHEIISNEIRKTLRQANIDAEPLILPEGSRCYFERVK